MNGLTCILARMIAASDTSSRGFQHHKSRIAPAYPPWFSDEMGRSQRVLPLRVHTNKRKWFTLATEPMHIPVRTLVVSNKGLEPQGFMAPVSGKLRYCARGSLSTSGERGNTMSANAKIEKFSARELLNLRNELLQSGIDSWQAAEVLSGFLTGRGYGVSAEHARNAISRLEEMGCNLDCMQKELENLAFVM